MKIKLLAGVALVAMAVTTGANAAPVIEGWYGALDFGRHQADDWRGVSAANAPDASPYAYSFGTDDDWAGFVRLGYRVAPHWRVEAEGGYRKGDIENVVGLGTRGPSSRLCTPGVVRTGAAAFCGSPGGKLDAYTLMGNVIFDMAPASRVNPFIGAGVSVSRVSMQTLGQFATVPLPVTANQNVQ